MALSTRDKIEFAVAMGAHTSATVRDVLALMRYASAYLATPIEGRRQRMEARMRKICAQIGAELEAGAGALWVVTGKTDIRIPV